jgi:hypothetical protein
VTVTFDEMMTGPDRLRYIIANFLSTKVPEIVDVLRSQYENYDVHTLPYPTKYDVYDPMQSGVELPVVGSYIINTEGWGAVDVLETGTEIFDATYNTTVFVVVQTPNLGVDESGIPKWAEPTRESAMRARDGLMTAIRAAILTWPSLGTAGEEYRSVINRRTIRETFPEAIQGAQTHIWLCSGTINMDINMRETNAVSTFGPVHVVDTVTEKIDDTP